jgi:glutathione S-transferase
MSEENKNQTFLYWDSGSVPCWRIQVVLEELNLTYDQKMLSFDKNEHKSEEILRLNPREQVNIDKKIFIS